MVRRGSTVRVRQRASVFSCSARGSVVLRDVGVGLWCPRNVHQRPPWTSSDTQLVEKTDRVLASVPCKVAVMPVDHREAGAHVAREVEGGDAGTESEGCEGVSEVVVVPTSAQL